jgi:hypothetical protein
MHKPRCTSSVVISYIMPDNLSILTMLHDSPALHAIVCIAAIRQTTIRCLACNPAWIFLLLCRVCISVCCSCPFHHSLHTLFTIIMTDPTGSLTARTAPSNMICPITDEYSVTIKDVCDAFIYASCRLLAMHRAINKIPYDEYLPQYPAAFYKNLCWEVEVSPSKSSLHAVH